MTDDTRQTSTTQRPAHRRVGSIWTLLAALVLFGSAAAQGYVLLEIQDPGFVAGQPWTGFGGGPADAGDVDGDGVFDILVGACFASPGGLFQAGTVYLFSGSTGALLRTMHGAAPYDHLCRVVRMGDVDGDGFGEHVMGAIPNGGPPAPGYVLIVSAASGVLLGTLTGLSPDEDFGRVVTGMDDVTGDGIADIAVSAPNADPGGLIDAGEIRVFSGATGTQVYSIPGTSPQDHLGTSMAARADHDGDGVVDIVAGAILNAGGRIEVYSGTTGSLLATYLPGPGDAFGWAVDHGPDYDGDGQADLVLGLPFNSPPLPPPCCLAGEVRVLSGASGVTLYSVHGNGSYDSFGTTVMVLGDLDADGLPEVAGTTPSGYMKVLSGQSGGLLFTVYGGGFSAIPAGDWNGDGIDEVLASAPWPPPGKVKVLSFVGIPTGSSSYGAGCPGSGGFVPKIVAAGGVPDVGTYLGAPTFQLGLLDALGGTPALSIIGVSNQSWGGIALPFDLGPLGLPGCSLLASLDAIVPVVTSGSGPGNGKAFVPIPIPPGAGLVGQTAYAQWYVVDPGPGLVPGAMSPGLALVIY